jgi:hypothetical protein
MSQKIPVPTHVEEMNLLDRVDYQDAFSVQTETRHTPEEWGRLALVQHAPPALRRIIRAVHHAIGLRLAPSGSGDHVAGWEILQNEPEYVVLGVEGRVLTPRIIVSTPPGSFVVSTLIRFDHVSARAAWTFVAPIHRAVARFLLDNAAKLEDAGRPVS